VGVPFALCYRFLQEPQIRVTGISLRFYVQTLTCKKAEVKDDAEEYITKRIKI